MFVARRIVSFRDVLPSREDVQLINGHAVHPNPERDEFRLKRSGD
jgi:hypothetical protein